LPITVSLALPQGAIESKVEAVLRVDMPRIQFGKGTFVRTTGERFAFKVPIHRQGFSARLHFSVAAPDFKIVSPVTEREDQVRFTLERIPGKGGLKSEVRVYALLSGNRLENPATILVHHESAFVASLDCPADLSQLFFVGGDRYLVGVAGDRRQQLLVWSTNGWSRLPDEGFVGEVLIHPRREWFLTRQRALLRVWIPEGEKGQVKKLECDPEHPGVALSANGSYLALRSLRIETVKKSLGGGVRVDGAAAVDRAQKKHPQFSIYDTRNWTATPMEEPVPTGGAAGVGSQRKYLIEGKSKQYRVHDMVASKSLYKLTGKEYARLILSADEEHMAAVGGDGIVRLLESATGKVRFATSPPAVRAATIQAVFLPGSDVLAVVAPDESCSLWQMKTGTKLLALEGKPQGHVEFSADGKRARDDQRVWDLADGKVVYTHQRGRLLGFITDSERVLACTEDMVLGLEIPSQRRLFEVRTSTSGVVAAALAGHGKRLAVGDKSGYVRVLEVSATAR
jgi:hypothetical protein